MMRVFFIFLLGALGAIRGADIFVSGTGGYHTYRIPAIVVAKNSAVLAFCEGRKNGASDTGQIDLLLKRSLDGGATWEETKVLRADGENVCGNPAPVVDQITGEIFLLMTWNRGSDTEKAILNGTSVEGRRVFVMSSKDHGATWSDAREITAEVKKPHWRWYATGPVNGIQLTKGTYRGRLVIPANHSDTDPTRHHYRSHVIFSDDHGASWKMGGIEDERTNESTVVELSDGTLLHNMRSYHGRNSRAVATSADGGQSWSPVTLDTNLVDSVCQASMLRLNDGRILFANPASKKRENMTLKVSADDGKSWTDFKSLHKGPSAYSCLAQRADGAILCVYERGEKSPYEKIALESFSVKALLSPQP